MNCCAPRDCLSLTASGSAKGRRTRDLIVRPAQLENSAEITFEIYGGLGRGYSTKIYDRGWMDCSRTKPPQTWRIGAGANMLLDRDLVLSLGGYDVDMGPGGVGGCGEDTLVFY